MRTAALCWVSVLLVLGCSDGGPSGAGAPIAVGASGASGVDAAGASAGAMSTVASGGASGAMTGGAGGNAGTQAGTAASMQASDMLDASDDAATDTVDGGDAAVATHATGPGDWVAGDYPPNLTDQTYLEITGLDGQAGNVRQYKVHVPKGYDPSVPTPVVFCIHGLAQNAVMFCVTGAGMDAKSDAEGFVLIMPNGFQNSWNAGTCCGGASTMQLDDVALFRAIFEEVGKHVNIDLNRVYATGLSNGAYMSYRLACEAADIFAAVAPGAGAIGKNDIGGGTNAMSDFTTCEPSRPVAVLDIHGTADGLIPYALQAKSLTHIAAQNGCGSSTQSARAPISSGDTTCVTYDDCPSGGEVTGCSIENGGHCWFGSADCGTGGGAIGLVFVGNNSNTMQNNDAIWDFFVRNAR